MPNTKIEDVSQMEFLEIGAPVPEGNTSNDKDIDDNSDSDKNETENIDNQPDPEDEVEDSSNDQTTDNDIEKTDNSDQQSDNEDSDKSGTQNETDTDTPDDDGEEAEENFFASMLENSGVEFEDSELEELLQTEQTADGILQVADKIGAKKAEKQFTSLMEQFPHAANMLQYEMAGGDPDKFYNAYFPSTDYETLEIQEDDVDTQQQIVEESLRLQGLEDEDIKSQIRDLRDAGILQKNAERSLKVLKKHQQQQKQEIEQEQQALQEQRQQQAQEQYENTLELVEQGEIEGVKIPKDKQDKFVKYLFEPVNDQGHTQAQLDSQELSLSQRLLLTYINFSGHNLEGFINAQSNSKSSKSLKDIIKKSSNKESLKRSGDNTNKPGKPSDIVSPFT